MRIIVVALGLAARSEAYTFLPYAGHDRPTLRPIDATHEEKLDALGMSADHRAGPFASVEDAACLMLQWLHEYWACHKLESGSNSCFDFGGCHKRCWWREAIPSVVLDLETLGNVLPDGDDALASLHARATSDRSRLAEADVIVLHGVLASFGTHHYCALRPAASRRREAGVRMLQQGGPGSDDAGAKGNDPRRRPGWSAKYRKLLPFAQARKTVRSIGFSSKEDWDEWVAEGKSLPWLGPYMPSRPDLMYEDEWTDWGDFLGTMLPFEEARMVARQLGITGQSAWWELVEARPEFVADLRIPARPHLVYAERWCGYDDWLGLEETTLYAPVPRAEDGGDERDDEFPT